MSFLDFSRNSSLPGPFDAGASLPVTPPASVSFCLSGLRAGFSHTHCTVAPLCYDDRHQCACKGVL